jgi:hypothetical protein
LWRERGYKIALVVDSNRDVLARRDMADVIIGSPDGYRGYARSVNALIEGIMTAKLSVNGANAEWFIAAGDDVQPDLNHSAEEIAAQCANYFEGMYWERAHHVGTLDAEQRAQVQTFGCMQPTGDRYGENEMHMGARGSAYVDRVCGSAWIGREFARRVNQGKGPLWPEYFHMGVDEELQAVATKLGVLWQRRDLIQYHQHWARKREKMPDFLKKANSGAEWDKYKKLFADRQKAGFPGSEVL